MDHTSRYEEVQVVCKWSFRAELDDLSWLASYTHIYHKDGYFQTQGVASLRPFLWKLDPSCIKNLDQPVYDAITN